MHTLFRIAKFLLGANILCFSITAQSIAMPDAKITVLVVDESGSPMPGIEVAIGFDGQGKVKAYKGFTDAAGTFSAANETAGGVSCAATKNGFYESRGRYDFSASQIQNNTWLPWNPEVRLILRKIGKPVPMYARDTKESRLDIPAVGKEIGFDLIEYNWLPPYGSGKHADFVFRLDKRFKNEKDFDSTLTITFSNPYDGIIFVKEERRHGSLFKLPRFAPESGYLSKLVKAMKRLPDGPLVDDSQEGGNYIFRVRSEVKDKKLVRAMYGKIQGDIVFDPRFQVGASLGFIYYLNPDYTRNLEYDPSANLFQNLKSFERVGL